MLQVSVIVRAKIPGASDIVEEETQTVVVNAHGGLMKLKMDVLVGQPIVLVNAKTKMEQTCRIVRVEHGVGTSAVAFEFDHPAPNFWPITFPPADWGASKS